MEKTESILHAVKSITRGVHLPHNKNTAEMASVIMPPPDRVVIPMQQHIGAPCNPTVKKGDKVYVGTVIGDSEEFVSAPIHSSVSGTVEKIDSIMLPSGKTVKTVVIVSDALMETDPSIKPVTVETREQLIKAARDSGLVGLGGAGFPAHVKLNFKPESGVDTLIINAAECEPYITSDYRECMENTENILEGIYLIKNIMGFKRVVIGVEDNKPKAIEALFKIAADQRDFDNSVRLMELKSRYPQGAEKVLIYSATGRELPFGRLPADVGCVVMNITSVSYLNKYIKTGMPLVSRIVTVDGGAVMKPQNVKAPIGTSINDIVEFCGGFRTSPRKVIFGGPMMGVSASDTSLPITKQNNAILVFNRKETRMLAEKPCIRCGRCAAACPMKLRPLDIEPALRIGDLDRVKELYAEYCMECGCCSYSCPSKRHLTQVLKLAKGELRAKK